MSALFPGLGHLAAGQRRWALGLASPMLALLLVATVIVLASNPTSLAARMFDPAVLTGLLVLQVIVLLWRLAAVAAIRTISPFQPRNRVLGLAAALAILIVAGPQLYLAGVTIDAHDAAAQVFAPVDGGGAWVPDATAPPVASDDPDFGMASPSVEPSVSPSPSPTPEVPRVNVLLIGIDSGVGRNTALTDTMIVASLDPVGRTISMASVARDTVDVPLPDGRIFRGKVNGLVSYVRWHPDKFPGAKDGQSVLAAAIGRLLNIDIQMWAQVNLGGFINLVNSVGGVTVNVSKAFCDPNYDEYGINGFGVSPGRYHMNGAQALAYARIRKAAGESDFTRAARQQEVIAALRDKLVRGAFLTNPSGFLRSLGQTVLTNVKPSFIADYLDIAAKIDRADVFRVVIGHPLVKPGYDSRGSIQIPDIAGIQAMAAKLFPPTGTRPVGFATMPSAGSGPTRNAVTSTTVASPRPRGQRLHPPRRRPRARQTRPHRALQRRPARRPRRRARRARPRRRAPALRRRQRPGRPRRPARAQVPVRRRRLVEASVRDRGPVISFFFFFFFFLPTRGALRLRVQSRGRRAAARTPGSRPCPRSAG